MAGAHAFGRYVLYPPIARGGMATVHPARLVGEGGFSRLVAAKRLQSQYADDPDLVAMFHDEAHIAARIHHPNVVPVLDVAMDEGEVVIVQEYVHGVPLNLLMRAAHATGAPIPIDIAVAILAGVLSGLHAAHESRDDTGVLLDVVHRDVSPHNVIVSVDGVARLLDFGIAKARLCVHHTVKGVFKGKLAYMAPEQMNLEPVTRRADLYAAGVLAWELFANRRFYAGDDEVAFVASIIEGTTPTLEQALASSPPWVQRERGAVVTRLEPVIAKALQLRPEDRFATAADMRDALLAVATPAIATDVAEWVAIAGADLLEARQRALAATTEESARSISRIAAATQAVAAVARQNDETVARSTDRHPRAGLLVTPTPTPTLLSSARRPIHVHRKAGPVPSPRAHRGLLALSAILLVLVGALGALLFLQPPPGVPITTVRLVPARETKEPAPPISPPASLLRREPVRSPPAKAR